MGRPAPGRGLAWLDPGRPEREIRERLGFEGRLDTFEHHVSHAASAFYYSGFPEAAVLTVDGVGEWATTTYGRADGADLTLFEEVEFPDSLGLFYSAITAYLGFRVNDDEYKVMGLAPYGEPRLLAAMRTIVRDGPGGSYSLDPACFDFLRGPRMFADALAERLGGPPRRSARGAHARSTTTWRAARRPAWRRSCSTRPASSTARTDASTCAWRAASR